jgi:hypothetical protein
VASRFNRWQFSSVGGALRLAAVNVVTGFPARPESDGTPAIPAMQMEYFGHIDYFPVRLERYC